MELILNATLSKKVDEVANKEFNYSPVQLMEVASYNIFINLISIIKKHNIRNILIITGVGNNAGDGFATAKYLIDADNLGFQLQKVKIIQVGDRSKMSLETRNNYNIWLKRTQFNDRAEYEFLEGEQIQQQHWVNNLANYELVIEALVGVGVRSVLKGDIKDLLYVLNEQLKRYKYIIKIAIDNPAGIDPDSGKVFTNEDGESVFFQADYTFVMFSKKLGNVLQNNRPLNKFGEIVVCPIGFSQRIFIDYCRENQITLPKKLSIQDFRKILPKRSDLSSKFSFGQVGILAGSRSFTGAAVIASNAALSIGTGLVYLFTDEANECRNLKSEVIKNTLDYKNLDDLCKNTLSKKEIFRIAKNYLQNFNRINVWLIGPGLSGGEGVLELALNLSFLALSENKMVILDADGLRIFQKLVERVKTELGEGYLTNLIITPHIFEYQRYIDPNFDLSLQDNPSELLINLTKSINQFQNTIHLKSLPAITCSTKDMYFNDNYNAALSKAGSGDCLAGIVAGLITQTSGKYFTETVAISSVIMSFLADKYTENANKESATATDLIDMIKFLD